MSGGWKREIIEPFNALVAPRELVWKEKYGTLRAEYLIGPDGTGSNVGPMGTVLEEASKLCCAECGRWNGWQRGADGEAARVKNKPVRGWWLTLCQWCRAKAEQETV
jgi:hypothetical protein